jgi:hypothetical protein
MKKNRFVTGFLDRRKKLFTLDLIDIRDRNRRALACQQLGNRGTYAGRTAGNQRDLS